MLWLRKSTTCPTFMNEVIVIGGGLAGVEAAWQAASAGAHVCLHEMRPVKQTPAHRTDKLAEIVCSNSLKSDEQGSASHLLKEELRRGHSLVMDAAMATRVPAGAALAVDRQLFAEYITERIESHPGIEIVRAEVTSVPLQRFEETRWFESCLPIEELARRGVDTLRYGPMKPVGLVVPRTEREPYAAVQLRQENLMADAYSMVGFQNHLRYGEQARVLRLIPGLEQAEFLQFGQIHRNTYINAPRVLAATMQMRSAANLFFAGHITGVEGYVESVAMGWLAGNNAARLLLGKELLLAPQRSAIGALARYVSGVETKNYQPVNITFALLEPLSTDLTRTVRRKRDRHLLQVKLALEEWDQWLQTAWKEREPVLAAATR